MLNFDTNYDLIIVGGGLVGNCLALALQDSGLKIALVEANTKQQLLNSPLGDRALALSAGTIGALKNLNIWQGVEAKATAITDIHVSDRGHFGKTRLSAHKEQVPALGYVIAARDIETHVANLVGETNATQFSPARVVEVASDEQAIRVSIEIEGNVLNLTGKLLVGADGGNSSIRKLLNISQRIREYNQTALVTTVKAALPHQNTAYERFTDSGPLALLPVDKNVCSVIWTRKNAEAEWLMAQSEDDFLNELQQCFGFRLGRLALTAPRRAFPVSLIRAQRMYANRAIIIGNAAHQLHPVAGQGFNLGLRDVIQLANMIQAYVKRYLDIGEDAFLQDYAKARQQDHHRTIMFTDSLVRVFSNDSLFLAGARNLGLTLLDHLPLAKKILSRHAMGLVQDIQI